MRNDDIMQHIFIVNTNEVVVRNVKGNELKSFYYVINYLIK